jgi:fibronectin type 3 domain-containing protein
MKRFRLLLVLFFCLCSATFAQSQSTTVTFGIQIGPGHAAVVSWKPSPTVGVTSYSVYRTTTSGTGYVKIVSLTAPTLNYADTAVVSGTTYYYVVTAVSPSGESAFSNQVTGVIP